MSKPVDLDTSREDTAPVPAGPGLSWREFFVRLGDGTLHRDAPDGACRDAAGRARKSPTRQPARAAR